MTCLVICHFQMNGYIPRVVQILVLRSSINFILKISPMAALPKIWKTKCMMKHKVFAWLFMMDSLNTWDMLVRRQCPIPDAKCVTCQQERETNEHLFFSCNFSLLCWSALGISWNMSLNLADRLSTAERLWKQPMFLECAIICAWNIWKQRNRKYFDNVDPDIQCWLAQFSSDIHLLGARLKPALRDQLFSFVSEVRV